MEQSIKDRTNYDTINTFTVGTGRRFDLTASSAGASNNATLSRSGDSFSSLNNIAGGADSTGAQNGHTFVIDGTTFTIDASGTGTGTTVGASGTNSDFHNRLRTSIIAQTAFDTVDIGSGGSNTLFSITSSVLGTSDNGVLSAGTGDTFDIQQQTAGGLNSTGSQNGHTFVIDGTTFTIDASGTGTGTTVGASGTDADDRDWETK